MMAPQSSLQLTVIRDWGCVVAVMVGVPWDLLSVHENNTEYHFWCGCDVGEGGGKLLAALSNRVCTSPRKHTHTTVPVLLPSSPLSPPCKPAPIAPSLSLVYRPLPLSLSSPLQPAPLSPLERAGHELGNAL